MSPKYIPFHLKYRPKEFKTIIGHVDITTYLDSIIKQDKLAFAYLIAGQHGSGKTTLARTMAKAINCTNNKFIPCNVCTNCINIDLEQTLDLYEIDGAKNTGIDNIREVIENLNFAPIINKYKICIIDEVHMLSNSAFNSLLKTLESPPINTVFILLTTSINKIPNTIISRCQKIFLPPIPKEDLSIAISKIAYKEKLRITNKGLNQIINLSQGSFRDALNIIEMFALENNVITLQDLNKKHCIPDSSIICSLVEKILLFNLVEVLIAISYIEDRHWGTKNIIDLMYKSLVYKYFQNRKLHSLDKKYFTNTKKFNDLLKILANYNSNSSSDLWKKITFFIMLNNITTMKCIKRKKQGKKNLCIKKYKIYSN